MRVIKGRIEPRTQKETTPLALANLLDCRINYDMNSFHVHLLWFLIRFS